MAETNANKYAYLDQLSTEELENILRADIDSPESGDDEAIYHIWEVMEKREREHPSGSFSDSDLERCWKDFQTLYHTPEGEGRSLYPTGDEEADGSPAPAPGKRRSGRVARRVILAAAILALLVSCMTIPVAGYASILEMIGAWTSEQFTLTSGDAGQAPDAEGFEGAEVFESTVGEELRSVLKEHGIQENVVPHWLPDGFEMNGDVSVREYEASKDIQISALYSDGTNSLTITVERHIGQPQMRIYEKIDNAPTIYVAGDIEHHIFSNTGTTTAVWNINDIECFINTTLSESDLKKAIDSIYEE